MRVLYTISFGDDEEGSLTLSNNLYPSWIPRCLALPSPNAHPTQTDGRNSSIPIPKLDARPHFRNSSLERNSSINPLLPSQWEIKWCPLGGGIITSIRGVAHVALPSAGTTWGHTKAVSSTPSERVSSCSYSPCMYQYDRSVSLPWPYKQ